MHFYNHSPSPWKEKVSGLKRILKKMNKRNLEETSVSESVLDSIKRLKNEESTENNNKTAESTIVYVKDGPFQRVQPYWFDYCTWAKGRWFNTPLLTVFRTEFRDRPAAYYAHACQAGLIRINDSPVTEEYRIRQGDRVQHRIHRHEPPVLAEPMPEILHVAEGLMVVSKPPSIPMHPSGRYRHNTLTSILLHRYPDLFPTGHISCVNRLDRLVSGIVIISRSAEKADELRRAMQDMKFRKFYLARVKGDFDQISMGHYSYACKNEDGVVECEAPLHLVEHKLGLSCVADSTTHPAAKSSHTRFIRLSYDPEADFSLILCEPVTGRTHQIRLHLQYLGYPIHNDPLYNNVFWRNILLKDDEKDAIYKSSDWIQKVKSMAQSLSKSSLFHQEDFSDYPETSFSTSSALCPDCENPLPDPDPLAMRIDLHAYKYEGPMGTFSTSLPEWAVTCKEKEKELSRAEEVFNKLAK
jgi:tRNA pseudouridine32 synthase